MPIFSATYMETSLFSMHRMKQRFDTNILFFRDVHRVGENEKNSRGSEGRRREFSMGNFYAISSRR